MSDTHEPLRQNVEQKAPDELVDRQRHPFGMVVIGAGFVGKGNRITFDRLDPVVGDGNPVGISSEVFQDLRRAGEWLLGVDDPVFLMESFEELMEVSWSFERGCSAGKDQFFVPVSLLEIEEELSAEDL